MKKIYNTLICGCMMAGVTLFSASCTDYLDKSADTDVSPEQAYANFTNFQGFVEEIYNCIPDKANCNFNVSFNWGDDELMDTNSNDYLGPQIDLGNFWAWQTAGNNFSIWVVITQPLRVVWLTPSGGMPGIAYARQTSVLPILIR